MQEMQWPVTSIFTASVKLQLLYIQVVRAGLGMGRWKTSKKTGFLFGLKRRMMLVLVTTCL
ncbi:hypothetical protein D3C81_1443010 [compost metagenome]